MMGGQVTESSGHGQICRENLKAQKVALITNDSEYGVAGADLFELYFKKMGGEIVARESVRPGEREYSSVLIRANAKTPEVIAIIQTSVDAGYTVKQAKRLGIKAKLLGPRRFILRKRLPLQARMQKACLPLPINLNRKPVPRHEGFGEKYKNKYDGFPPSIRGGL